MLNDLIRGILILVLLLMTAGFGLCGAYATAAGIKAAVEGLHGSGGSGELLFFGCMGLGLATVCIVAAVALWREKRNLKK